jgi:cell division protein FtsB
MAKIKRDPKKSQRFISTVFFVAVVIYMIGILSKSLWDNYQVNQEIKTLRQEVAILEEQNQRLKNLIVYYQTDSYKEKEARRKLLMRKPDERVLALPETDYSHESIDIEEEAKEQEQQYQEPNYQLWIDYIFS